MVVVVRHYHCREPTGKGKEKVSLEIMGRMYLTKGMAGDISIKNILKREALGMYQTNVKFPSASVLI